MNEYWADIGYLSVNHYGEELCGDKVEIAGNDSEKVIVLADGLGSGVRANILATLTSKLLSTMLAQGISLEECIQTLACTLPVNKASGVAYSTFTVILLAENKTAKVIEFDNPQLILFRQGESQDLARVKMKIGGKDIYRSEIDLQENDILLVTSDGVPYAGSGVSYNFGWQRDDIISYLGPITLANYSAKCLATILIEKVKELYLAKPGDDATALVVRLCPRQAVNLLVGPPDDRDDCQRMLNLFFGHGGKHIIAGGTTSKIVADYLGEKLIVKVDYSDPNIPPTASLEGVDLVTEGVITLAQVVKYLEDYLADNKDFPIWSEQKDGASLMTEMLVAQASDITIYAGKAVNPGQQDKDSPLNFEHKMELVKKLADNLTKMGKQVVVTYF